MYTGTLQPVSNKADWSQAIQVIDSETDEAIAPAAVALWICRQGNAERAELSGDNDDGKLVLTDDGFDIAFTADDMSALCAGTYDIYVRVETSAGAIVQLIVGSLPVVEGGPTW
jgi:hypothetical protein